MPTVEINPPRTANLPRKSASLLKPPPSHLPGSEARRRYDYFGYFKLWQIEGILGRRQQDLFRYHALEFLRLIDKININSGNGLRVYFAVDPAGPVMTLIYSITNGSGTNQTNDIGQYFIFDAAGMLQDIAKVDASNWVTEFRKPKGVLSALTNGGSQWPDTTDTKALWYSIETMQATASDIRTKYAGRLDHLLITAFLGAYQADIQGPALQDFDYGPAIGMWEGLDVTNRMTIVFGTGRKPDETLFEPSAIKRAWKKVTRFAALLFEPDNYDTGAPCPPAEGCGAGLP
jgi:hypothetical protein